MTIGTVPDARGRFGPYGGRFVPEALVAALDELGTEYLNTGTTGSAYGDYVRKASLEALDTSAQLKQVAGSYRSTAQYPQNAFARGHGRPAAPPPNTCAPGIYAASHVPVLEAVSPALASILHGPLGQGLM